MQKFSLLPPIDIKINKFKLFISEKQIDIFNNNILPKFLSSFKNKQKIKWQKIINNQFKSKHLSFKAEDAFLIANNITRNNVIENSIKYILKDIDSVELKYLVKYFSIYKENNKIKLMADNNMPVYLEIIEILEYINQIKTILDTYPKHNGNHLGTKHRSSSYKKLLTTQLNLLDNRLNGIFFALQNEEEIKQTKSYIKFIKLALTKEYQNLPEWLNYANIYIGFDNKFLNNSESDIQMLNQLVYFFNGIKTSKEELLKSVTIFLNEKIANKNNNLYKNYADTIMDIIRYFFNKDIVDIQKEKKKKTFTYNMKHVKKPYHVKTYLDDVPIFVYTNNNSNDHLYELFTNVFHSMLGLNNLFDKDNPTEDEISNFKIVKNLINLRKEFNLTKIEFKTILHISKSFNITN